MAGSSSITPSVLTSKHIHLPSFHLHPFTLSLLLTLITLLYTSTISFSTQASWSSTISITELTFLPSLLQVPSYHTLFSLPSSLLLPLFLPNHLQHSILLLSHHPFTLPLPPSIVIIPTLLSLHHRLHHTILFTIIFFFLSLSSSSYTLTCLSTSLVLLFQVFFFTFPSLSELFELHFFHLVFRKDYKYQAGNIAKDRHTRSHRQVDKGTSGQIYNRKKMF